MNTENSNAKTRRPSRLPVPATTLLAGLCVAPSLSASSQTNGATSHSALDSVVVTDRFRSLHDVASESDRVGPANQPEWTTRRAFAETDVYVIPPGAFEFNQFYILSHPREGRPESMFESEFEFGLPWRTQFDVELNYSIEDKLQYDSTLVELPHALADWGKLPLNPAINAGWRFRNEETDSYILGLLLAEEFGQRFHFGSDLRFERQVGGEFETTYELNTALSYVAIDSKLTLGVELLVEYETAKEIEDGEIEREYETMVMLGPSLLFKPTRNTHLGVVALFGVTHDAPAVETFFTFGIDLEPLLWGRSSSEQDRVRPVRRSR